MMATSSRGDPLSFLNPSASSPITGSNSDSSRIGSAPGSFQNEGFLGSLDAGVEGSIDETFGFSRPDFRQDSLVGTVEFCERHVFLRYKNPQVWPPRIETAEFDRLPRLLSAVLSARKPDMKRETRLTLCEGYDGTETSNGDVLIFPDMVRYRKLTHFDVDTFVDEVLVNDNEWFPGTPETLKGWYIFVCCHGTRDRRCGVCGPPLVSRFNEEIELRGLQNKVSVCACSHVGGHKYAGNVIIFGPNLRKQVSGHWYGYVSPDDVPVLLEQHIMKGHIVDWLWRGQMGISEEEQRRSQAIRLKLNGGHNDDDAERSTNGLTQIDLRDDICKSQSDGLGCCQENGNSICCQNQLEKHNHYNEEIETDKRMVEKSNKSMKRRVSQQNSGKRVSSSKLRFENWEYEDTYAVLAVVAAIASVGFAYSCYKRLN